MGYSTHAIIYSKEGIEACLERWKPFTEEPVDMFMSKEIMPLGKSFCTIPMLVTQRPSKSDIDGRFYDWGPMLHGKFENYTKHLK